MTVLLSVCVFCDVRCVVFLVLCFVCLRGFVLRDVFYVMFLFVWGVLFCSHDLLMFFVFFVCVCFVRNSISAFIVFRTCF